MKKRTSENYCSPRIEQMVLICEQAIMAASMLTTTSWAFDEAGIDNEEFVLGDTYQGGWN